MNGLLAVDGGMLAVDADGTAAGRVEWFASQWGRRSTPTGWSIAVGIRDGRRGIGIGTLAQRLLVAYLFDHTRAERIQATTDVDNVAERRCLEKLGFRCEGMLRSAQWRNGRFRDLAMYAALRGDERP